jgi:CPA1 family monovalent cation:H+ antiporter
VRVPSYAVWEVAVFVLNVLAFILVGFQLRQIVVRDGWTRHIPRRRRRVRRGDRRAHPLGVRRRGGEPLALPRRSERDVVSLSGRAAYVVGWCGMRGTVTLAARARPASQLPYRDIIFFTSFAVVLVTLVVQGMTLRPLLSWLDLHDDGTVEREVQHARTEILHAALDAVRTCGGGETAELLRRRYELRLRHAEGHEHNDDDTHDAEIIRTALAASGAG